MSLEVVVVPVVVVGSVEVMVIAWVVGFVVVVVAVVGVSVDVMVDVVVIGSVKVAVVVGVHSEKVQSCFGCCALIQAVNVISFQLCGTHRVSWHKMTQLRIVFVNGMRDCNRLGLQCLECSSSLVNIGELYLSVMSGTNGHPDNRIQGT